MSSASVDALGQQPSTVSHVFHMPRKAAMEDAFVMRIGKVTSVNETYQALPTVIQNVAVAQGQPTTNVSHEQNMPKRIVSVHAFVTRNGRETIALKIRTTTAAAILSVLDVQDPTLLTARGVLTMQ